MKDLSPVSGGNAKVLQKTNAMNLPMQSISPAVSVWVRGLIACLTYALSGLLTVKLSLSDQHVSPLFLASGLGLAFVLAWGPGMLLAVGLGSAAVAVLTLLGHSTPPALPALAMLAVFGGLGAALQAWVAARLTRPLTGQTLALDTPRDIGIFLLLAGPASCIVNAVVSVGARVALGVTPMEAAPEVMASWWMGDTLGVLLATPLLLTLIGQPADLWRERRAVVGLPLLIATVVLLLALRQLQAWRIDKEDAVFRQDAAATATSVKLHLHGYMDALAALQGVFDASDNVTRDEFSRAARHWIESMPGVQAMAWAERVKLADVAAFEARQQADGMTGFRAQVLPAKDAAQAAHQGEEAMLVRYAEPRQGNESLLGQDLLAGGARALAVEQARRQGRAIAAQALGGAPLVHVFMPVYKGQAFTPQARLQANVGTLSVNLDMRAAVSAMLKSRPAYLNACLLDATSGRGIPLGGSDPCLPNGQKLPPHHASTSIDFAGRQWQLLSWSARAIPVPGLAPLTWMVDIGGVALAAALGGLLLVLTGHRRRLEAAMSEARRRRAEAESANKAKTEFLSRMSHELRTPLNAVLGFAQLLEIDPKEPLTPTQAKNVGQIQVAGWHLLDMIDDVLDISRIESGSLRLQAEPLPVRDELIHAMKALQPQARQQGVELTLSGAVEADWLVLADPTRLRQILSNLLSNAIKFNHQGGQVRLKVTREGDARGPRLRIAIHDTGLGMSEAQLAQLFQPFNRLGREQGGPGGTGIGLVVAQHLAVLMQGQIDAHSKEGEGSTFTLTLPEAPAGVVVGLSAAATDQANVVMPEQATANAEPAARHVLYVEDNLANSEVIRAALEARPWIKVTVAPTTEEGLAVLHDRLRGSKPDLVLLDIHLPDASGIELLKLVKSNPDTAAIPVIMISADAVPEQIDAALEAGASCYMTKPVQIGELLRQVDELIPA
jgi:signal transduction histidine kinase/CheY-like chemotaxis protein/integral membrane sensor domain MASE1